VVEQPWRGLGVLPAGGLALQGPYRQLDARQRFVLEAGAEAVGAAAGAIADPCISGQILRGLAQPPDCPAFGSACTPEHPLGAPMVSSEGACAAYYRYRPPLACGAASIRP
jgi:hydrogenase expression/formation protein HypD